MAHFFLPESRSRLSRQPLLFALILIVAAVSVPGGQQQSGGRWRTAWATSQQGLGTANISNTTVRLIARTTIGGDAVRLRFDNTYGKSPLKIARAFVGIRSRGASLVAGSNQPVRFGGAESATVPPGGSVRSDAVPMRLLGRQDLAVSLFIPEESVLPSQHAGAVVTSYAAAAGAGDRTAAESNESFTVTMTTMPWLKSIDVMSASATGAIVAFGDSITDGTCATLDASDRWEDWLSLRLALDDDHRGGPKRYKSVINEGIGGNTVTREGLQPAPDSTPGLERLERDVLSHEGVTDVIVFMGTNDIRRGASAAQVTGGLSQIVQRLKQRGFKVYGATIIPRHNVAASGTNTGWDDRKTAIRREANDWIRTRGSFDGVIDFDRVVRDPANPDRIFAPFDCDGIHPNPRGYFEMGKSLSLDLFTR
jgi:lysophospholipase L1-like esterase